MTTIEVVHLVACNRRAQAGLTIIELLIVMLIMGILLGIATQSYQAYIERARVATAMADIRDIDVKIAQFVADNRELPDSLADVGAGALDDPWGNPYEYFNHTTAKGKGSFRKDKHLNPINSDYDLYSKGKDGASAGPLNAKKSRDDVVRAADGRYVGLAEDF